ncbi:hypothetical protein NPIL_542591 [Nephila pilipes]|uniref:Uncharacterized protein n=1 Tax=Nephila pilipes TaxID=299642 RepID=A0A8X6NBB2_NEPPI|nr:hypothetical protein NPIL_542591 [Nephila pilipes]
MARTKQTPSGGKQARATDALECDDVEENLEPVKMADVSNLAPDDSFTKPPPLDQCKNLQITIEEYALSINGTSEVEAQIRQTQLFPFMYGAQEAENLNQELLRWKADKENIEGKGQVSTKSNNRNKTFTSNTVRPNTSYAQAIHKNLPQQREPLDGGLPEATPEPRGINNQNSPSNNQNNNQTTESDNGFTMFDAIKELKTLFKCFPNLKEACHKMSKTVDKIDKLNIFIEAICTEI